MSASATQGGHKQPPKTEPSHRVGCDASTCPADSLPAVVRGRLDEVQLEQFAGDRVRQLVPEPERRAIGRHVGAGHHPVTDAVLA